MTAEQNFEVSHDNHHKPLDVLIEENGGQVRFTKLVRSCLYSPELNIGKNLENEKMDIFQVDQFLNKLTETFLKDLLDGNKHTASSFSEAFNLAFNSPHVVVRATAFNYLSGRRLAELKTAEGKEVFRKRGRASNSEVNTLFDKVYSVAANEISEVKVQAVNLLGQITTLALNSKSDSVHSTKVLDVSSFSKKASQDFKKLIKDEKDSKVLKSLLYNSLIISVDPNFGGQGKLKTDWAFVKPQIFKFVENPKYAENAVELIFDVMSSSWQEFRKISFQEPFTIKMVQRIIKNADSTYDVNKVLLKDRSRELFMELLNNEEIHPELFEAIASALF